MAKDVKRTARISRKIEAEHRRDRLQHDAPEPSIRDLSPSRAELWKWYQAVGKSWAEFVADHGVG